MNELDELIADLQKAYYDVADNDSFDWLHDTAMKKSAVKKLLDRLRYADELIKEIKVWSPKSHTIAIERYERAGRDDEIKI